METPARLAGMAGEPASEFAARGVTFVPVPEDALWQAVDVFERLSRHTSAEPSDTEVVRVELAECCAMPQWCESLVGCLPWAPLLSFQVSDHDDGTGHKAEALRYANPVLRKTLVALAEPFVAVLESIGSQVFGTNERVVTVNAQYIFGNAKSDTHAHRDFRSRNTVSLLTPLYEYAPEEASLHYWRFDENPELYATNDMATARRMRTYAYTRGEAVVFSGDLYHQTVPFQQPKAGWGERQWRTLFCIVMVAADSLQLEDNYEGIVGDMRSTTGGYLVDPVTEEWLTSSSSDSSASEATDGEGAVDS